MLRSVFCWKYFLALFCIVFGGPLLAAQLTPEQQAAKERGIILYNQHKAISAEPYLKTAAEAGDRVSQYYLGEAIRFNKRYMTAEAHKWYVAAAEQGDMYAMRRLASASGDLCNAMGNCPQVAKTALDWLKLLVATAEPLIKQGDGEAMYLMYQATGDLEWLEKSADAGYAFGQYWLAVQYRQGEGFFFLPWKRKEKIEELYRRAAEGGDANGMSEYIGVLSRREDFSGSRFWLEKCAETGFTSCYSDYAASLADPENDVGISVDYVKAYALTSLLLELNGGGGDVRLCRRKASEDRKENDSRANRGVQGGCKTMEVDSSAALVLSGQVRVLV